MHKLHHLFLLFVLGFCFFPGSSSAMAAGAVQPQKQPERKITSLAVSRAGNHICALTSRGIVQCWGYNGYGQLGDGTTIDSSNPVTAVGIASGAKSLAAGKDFTCAVTAVGAVMCWGYNWYGQLGDGSVINRTAPVAVSGLTSGVRTVTAGRYHTCALTTSGGVKCWGYNGQGQLGDGTATSHRTPIDVNGLTSGVSAIAAGGYHTCALKTDGSLLCWGDNSAGSLGDGTVSNRTEPVNVNGLDGKVSAVSAGIHHTCALLNKGTVQCWGANHSGQLGDGSLTDRAVPAEVTGLNEEVTFLAAGDDYACVVVDGKIYCWGENGDGQLGDGTTIDRSTPVAVNNLTEEAEIVAAGSINSCAALDDGGISCWGDNRYGQLGVGKTTRQRTPASVSSLPGTIGAISAGEQHTCAVTTAGAPKCWGNNSYGQLGDGTTINRSLPVGVSELTGGVSSVAVGIHHTCALTTSGGVKCWGDNSYGQLGNFTTYSSLTPVDVYTLSSGVVALTAGEYHTCALTTAGAVKCWGYNAYGQLGDNSYIADRTVPVQVDGLTSGVKAITSGNNYSCALTQADGVKCWGKIYDGQPGDDGTSPQIFPVAVTGLTDEITAFAAGTTHTCALLKDGSVKCWGQNNSGQLGDGTTKSQLTPQKVNGLTETVTAITSGGDHTCALTAAGKVFCWGDNLDGALGDSTSVNRSAPVRVNGMTDSASAVTAGSTHTCALSAAGSVQCWGYGGDGQLGTITDLWAPASVVGIVNDLVSAWIYLPMINQ